MKSIKRNKVFELGGVTVAKHRRLTGEFTLSLAMEVYEEKRKNKINWN